MPLQLVVTIMLLRSTRGVLTASAWVAGMATVKVLQGVIFGFVLTGADDATDAGRADTSSPVTATLLLMVAVLFVLTAIRQIVRHVDEDAPPPRWMSMISSATPARAFLLGMGVMAIGAKFWAFTLGAVGAVVDADLSTAAAVGIFLLYVVLTLLLHLAVISMPLVAPQRSQTVLDAAIEWLQRNNRPIMIILGFVFGTWFLIKALAGYGMIMTG